MKGILLVNSRHLHWLALCCAIAVVFSACGGRSADITGTGDNPDAQPASEEGEVQGYGSLIVNGTHYRTDAATRIEIDGAPASESELALGMVVSVELASSELGKDAALARAIITRTPVEGPIEAIDRTRNQFTVLGVTVQADQLTRIFSADNRAARLADLAIGDIIQAGGFRRASGGFLASFIRQRAPRSEAFVLRGRISELDEAQLRFRLNEVTVDYASASVMPDSGQLENNALVEVIGQTDSQGARFMAERLTQLADASAARRLRSGVQGVVRSIDPSSSCPNLRLVVNDQAIRTTPDSRYENGRCTDIEVEGRLQARGRLDVDGSLVADELILAPALTAIAIAQLQGLTVSSSPAENGPLCTLRILGDLPIEVVRQTRQGPRETDGRSYGCADAQLGDAVLVVGEFVEETGAERIQAALLQRAPEFQDVPAQFGDFSLAAGQLQELNPLARRFRLLRTRVQISDDTDFGDSSEQAFFAQARVGDFTSVLGRWNGSFIEALAVRRSFDREFR